MLAVFTEVEPFATMSRRGWILSDGIKEHEIQISNCEIVSEVSLQRKADVRTIVNVYIGPEVFPCANGSRLAAV